MSVLGIQFPGAIISSSKVRRRLCGPLRGPVLGAVGVAGHACFDTAQVAKTASELFEGGVEIDAPDETEAT